MTVSFSWVNDYDRIIRAVVFDDDNVYAGSIGPAVAVALENAAKAEVAKVGTDNRVYKIEDETGSLIGYVILFVKKIITITKLKLRQPMDSDPAAIAAVANALKEHVKTISSLYAD